MGSIFEFTVPENRMFTTLLGTLARIGTTFVEHDWAIGETYHHRQLSCCTKIGGALILGVIQMK